MASAFSRSRSIVKKTVLLALFTSMLAPLLSWADDKPAGAAIRTGEVVVTATRTERELQEVPVSISVVTQEEIQRSSATTVADALQDIPGVEVFDQSIAGGKRVQIRGESGARVLVLIDGQKISEQKSMDGAALLIDPNRIEQVEVIKGPASVLYGSEAIGGVVNIITKKGGERPLQAEASATYDTSATGRVGYASAFGRYEGLSYRVSGSLTDYGNRRTPDGTLDNTSYDIRDFSAFFGHDWKKISIGATVEDYKSEIQSHTPEGTTGSVLTYFQLDLPQWERRKAGAFFEARDISDFFTRVRVDCYYQNTFKEFKNDMILSIPMGPMGRLIRDMRQRTENDQDTYGGLIQTDWRPLQNHYLIIGYEPGFDRLDSTLDVVTVQRSPLPPPFGTTTTTVQSFDYKAEMDTHAVYIQDEWTLPADFTLTLGGRQTWVDSSLTDTNNPNIEKDSKKDSKPVFSAGLTYAGIRHLVLRSLFAQGYRFPNLQQLFIGTVHGGADPTFPNPDLDPETSNNYELGLRFKNQVLAIDIAGFFSDAKDYITTEPVAGGRQFTNVEKAKTYGVEATASYTFSDWGLTPYASGTWLRRKFESEDFTTWNTGHPEWMGRLGLRYQQDFWTSRLRLFADLYARAAVSAEEEFSDGTREKYKSWETFNLTLGGEFGQKRRHFAAVSLNNLFDQEYTRAQSTLVEQGFHAVLKVGTSF